MPISITFQNDLVRKLEFEAKRRHVSVEELATSILDQAVSAGPTAGQMSRLKSLLSCSRERGSFHSAR